MSDNVMPTKEIIELIKGQARMEEKLDSFLRVQTTMKSDLDSVKKDVADLKSARVADRAYVAGISSAVSMAMIFLVPYFKNLMGL